MEELNYDDIKPQPIKINDIAYRSKLEARWAIFLSSLVFSCEHEPKYAYEHFSGWLPDFAIIPSFRDTQCVYCEVKPLTLEHLPLLVSNKIEKAERDRKGDIDNDIPVLILGAKVPAICKGKFSLGWVSYRKRNGTRNWQPLPIFPFVELVAPYLLKYQVGLLKAFECQWERTTKCVTEITPIHEICAELESRYENEQKEKERRRRIAQANYFAFGKNDLI